MTIIFVASKISKNEYGTHRDIEVIRFTHGGVLVTIGTWSDCDKKTVKAYQLSPENAAELGRALLCIDDDTVGETPMRAQEMQ